jgi:hypothetical protein
MDMFNKFDWKIHKKLFDLQMFAEDGDNGGADPDTPEKTPNEPGNDPKPAAKYTDEDVDKILNKKFAEWQKNQEKKVSEAERLSKMTAEEKAAEKLKALEDKIKGYEAAAARTEMAKQARAILSDKGISVGDELLANLIAEDADATKAAVESFVSLFTAAVEKAVKEKVKGDTPKAGGSSGITKEQILKIQNRAERQRLMAEHKDLF